MNEYAASPCSFTPQSSQWPKRSRRFMYSSARFTPPVNATSLSITQILRWSRLLNVPVSTGWKRWNVQQRMPSFSMRFA